ncbi:alpha/beta fold hydrolase [Rhodobacterales bacterium HKCCE3408]|nr:alpha/beta fold hydrolase [Rhodobacterales bacterium HKCCE3408]
MRRGRRILGALLVLVAGIAVLMLSAPRETVERSGPFEGDLSDPAAYLAEKEAGVEGIVPGTEARIVWAGEASAVTDIAVLYLHGFSATSEEIRPVPDNVAAALGANLVFARLRGHGRDGAAMAEPEPGDWIDDTAEALAVARAVGREVLVIGTSTGATLSAIAATEPDMAEDLAGIVMLSPNFHLRNPIARLLTWPWARVWVPWVAGETWNPGIEVEGFAEYWTESYPTVATVPLAALMRDARRRDYSGVDLPLLMIVSPEDRVISPAAAEAVANRWGGPMTLVRVDLPETGVDPYSHVIAGDILSPAMTDEVTGTIIDWARAALP